MRLWHKSLIKVLPQKQLISQWRELSAIVGNIELHGTPNHLLVNKVLKYPKSHLLSYTNLVAEEMKRRGKNPKQSVYDKIKDYCGDCKAVDFSELFEGWHNERYLNQCFSNLEEKFDCGGVTEREWESIVDQICEIGATE